jgi:predicted CxxxxCH...CXXCH cytochrome family protein
MHHVLKKQTQGLSWLMRVSLVLLLTLLSSLFSVHGLYGPRSAEAAVAAVNNWAATAVYDGALNPSTATAFTTGAGTNRLLLVAVKYETSAVGAHTVNVTYGTKTVGKILNQVGNTQGLWIGFLKEADIAAAGSTSILSTITLASGTLTRQTIHAALYSGVNQSFPIVDAESNFSATTAATLAVPSALTEVASGYAAYFTNVNSAAAAAVTPFTGFTEQLDQFYTTYNLSIASKATAAATETVSVSWTGAVACSLAAVSLRPDTDTSITNVITTCTGCHANPPADGARSGVTGQFLGSHVMHATTYAYACTQCHYNNAVNKHSDGFKNITGTLLPGNAYTAGKKIAITNTPAFGSCTNTYCHSAGTGGTSHAGDNRAKGAAAATLTWGNTGACTSCHTGGITTGPTYATGSPKANSHAGHVVIGGYTCDYCHFATSSNGTTITSKAIHADRVYNVSANTAKTAAFTYTYAVNGGTCATTQCHGSTVPVWGVNTTNDTCTKCHGTPTAGTATPLQTAPTVPATAAHAAHMTTASTFAMTVACNECHETVATAATPGHMDGIKTIQFNGAIGKANSTIPTNTLAGCATTWCHGAGGTNILLPQNKPTARTAPTWGTTFGTTSALGDALGTASTNTGSGRCAKCHGYPPATVDHSGVALTGSKACNTCHSNLTTNGTFVSAALHVNGIVEGGGSCTGCHGTKGNRVDVTAQFTAAANSHHYQGTTAIDGKTCYACHWEANSDGSENTLYHLKGSNQVVDLVIWNATTRPTTYTANVTAITYQSGGTASSARTEFAKINNHCVGCHRTPNAAIVPFPTDPNTPVKYAWDGTSVDARYSNTGTTAWGKFTNPANVNKALTKAFSAHGNTANQRGWSSVVDTFVNGTGYNSKILCFDCHNSHGSSTAAAGVTSSYSSATGRRKGGILKDVVAGKGGYTVAYKPAAGGTTAQKNVYNPGAALCFDCHNSATASTAVGGGSTPWGYTATFGFVPPAAQGTGRGVIGYWDTPHFGDVGTNFIPTLTFAYKAGRSVNQGGHFGASAGLTTAITKRSFDPGTPTGNVIQGLCTPCHDPHGVSTAATATTAQAYSVPMLKGTWVTSPYKQDAAPSSTAIVKGSTSGSVSTGSNAGYKLDHNSMVASGTIVNGLWAWAASATTLQTTNDTQFAGLCTGCHAKAAINSSAAAAAANWKTVGRIHNSVKGWASTAGGNANNAAHAYTCSKCHSPHNARLPRLLVTNCLDVKHRGRVASGGNMSAALAGSKGSSSGLGRFPGGGGGTSGGYFFGTTGSAVTKACHDSATAGGATFTTAGELWNSKSVW